MCDGAVLRNRLFHYVLDSCSRERNLICKFWSLLNRLWKGKFCVSEKPIVGPPNDCLCRLTLSCQDITGSIRIHHFPLYYSLYSFTQIEGWTLAQGQEEKYANFLKYMCMFFFSWWPYSFYTNKHVVILNWPRIGWRILLCCQWWQRESRCKKPLFTGILRSLHVLKK